MPWQAGVELVSARSWIAAGGVPRVTVPTAIFPGLVAGLPAARVYAALVMRAHSVTGLVDSTVKQIADDAQMGTSQVSSGLARLIADGWVSKVRQGNSRQSNRYQMHAEPHGGRPGFPEGSSVVEPSGNPEGLAGGEGAGFPEGPEGAGPSGNPEGLEPAGLSGNPGGPEPSGNPERSGNPEGLTGQYVRSARLDPPEIREPSLKDKNLTTKDLTTLPASRASDTPTADLFGEPLAVVHQLKPKPTKRTKTPAGYTPDFERFWAAYPRHEAKKRALAAWTKALDSADAETIIDGAARFAAVRHGQDPRYTPHPASWLNDGRWDDELAAPRRQASGDYQSWQNPTNHDDYDAPL